MLNVNNIIQSPIIDDPWRHQIISNFFNESDFKKIEIAASKLSERYKGTVITSGDCLSFAHVYDIIGSEVFDIIFESNRTILDNMKDIIKQYPNHRQFNNYISIPTFHILPPNVAPQKVHDEAYDKTASFVVYLYPTNSVGTAMFRTQDRDSFVKEIEWSPNTGMLFCGEQNVTWHDFYSKDMPRVTLNYFLRQLNDQELSETRDHYYWKHLEGPITYIPKSLPADKLKLTLTGMFQSI
jgi:hypothetical protein